MENEADRLPEVLTAAEAAEYLRCNVKTIYAAVRDHRLPSRRVGRRIVISRDALREWMKGEGQ